MHYRTTTLRGFDSGSDMETAMNIIDQSNNPTNLPLALIERAQRLRGKIVLNDDGTYTLTDGNDSHDGLVDAAAISVELDRWDEIDA